MPAQAPVTARSQVQGKICSRGHGRVEDSSNNAQSSAFGGKCLSVDDATGVRLCIAAVPESPLDESVYNLIPYRIAPPDRPPRYVSRFHNMACTEYASGQRAMASMGPLRVVIGDPHEFLHKGDGLHLRESANSAPQKPDRTVNKAPLPNWRDKSNHGQPNSRSPDFVRSNRNTAAHSHPPPAPKSPRSYKAKTNYGRPPHFPEPPNPVPRFPQEERRLAKEAIENAQREQIALATRLVPLPEEERLLLLQGLRENWNRLNSDYQKLSLTVDTIPKINRKMHIEQQLKNIESDIKRFSQEHIFVRIQQ